MSRRAPRVGRCSGGAEPDWTPLASGTTPSGALTAAASLLENETWTKAFTYDASSRVTSATMPDSSELLPSYNEAGLLDGVDVKIRGASTVATFVDDIDYDAHGRRTRIEYGNTTATEYFYDDLTFRLTRIRTTRSTDSKTLQDLKYTYDPVGNILEVHDDAHEDVFYNDAQVEATGQYEYDPIYRLNQATGREHSGGVGDAQRDQNDLPLWNLPHPNDAAALRRYVEEYTYDKVGNLLEFAHEGLGGPSGATWTRTYRYDTGVTSGYANNRLHSTSEPGSAWASYTHDANGNMVAMPHLATLDYTHRDQMQHADLGGGGDAYYTYDGGGERVRKFIQRTGTTTEERIYLGGWELYRKRQGAAGDVVLERETLHVMDDTRRIAMVETKTVDADVAGALAVVPRTRYQYSNHLDSAHLECDETGLVISYEEYHPYGTPAYRSARSGVEVWLPITKPEEPNISRAEIGGRHEQIDSTLIQNCERRCGRASPPIDIEPVLQAGVRRWHKHGSPRDFLASWRLCSGIVRGTLRRLAWQRRRDPVAAPGATPIDQQLSADLGEHYPEQEADDSFAFPTRARELQRRRHVSGG